MLKWSRDETSDALGIASVADRLEFQILQSALTLDGRNDRSPANTTSVVAR